MNSIEKLVEELCPEGVEFRSIESLVSRISNIRWADFPESEFRYIDLSSVDRVTHAIGETLPITEEDAPSRAQQIVKKNDVIFGTTRPMLKRYAMIPDELDGQICSTGFCVLRPNEQIIPSFLF